MSTSESISRKRRGSSADLGVYANESSKSDGAKRRRTRSRDLRLLVAPLLALILPGLAQWRQHMRGIAMVGIVATALNWVGLAWLAAFWFFDRRTFFSIGTDTNGLLGIEIWCVVYLLICLALGVHLIWITSNSGLRTTAKALVAAGVAIATAIQVVCFGIGAGSIQDARNAIIDITAQHGDAAYAAEAPRYNILLLGGDAGVGRIGLRPDSISVLSINRNTGKTLIIGLPRNLQRAQFVKGSPMLKPFPHGFNCGPVNCLLNEVYAYGQSHKKLYKAAKYKGLSAGVQATKDAVAGTLGLKIHYVAITDMGAFATLVYAVGGIDVCVPKRIIAEDKKSVFEKGCQHMGGGRALLYARSRYDSNDYNRMLKQRALERALIAQITPEKLIFGFHRILKAGSKYVSTSIPEGSLGELVNLAYMARNLPVANLEIAPPKFSMVSPNFQAIRKAVRVAISKN